MLASLSLLLAGAAFSIAKPLEARTVAALNTAAFEKAQKADITATKAFSATSIKTSSGQCLFVNELSGDFRANLNPIQAAACDGSKGQQWDIITKGAHNDQPGNMLIVNTLTEACMNFDPRRAAGNQVIMFSCGGRADGGGAVTNSQLFPFAGGAGPLAISPLNDAGTCLTVTNNVLAPVTCNTGDASQKFTFGGGAAAAPASANVASTTAKAAASSTPQATAAPSTAAADQGSCGGTTFITVTRDASPQAASPQADTAAPTEAASSKAAASSSPPAVSSAAAASGNIPSTNPTTPLPVSRAGGVLNPSSAAEANARDDNATRAFTSVSLKSGITGQCLFIDPTAGDFRQNLIPVSVKDCTGSANEKFDLITSGKHNNGQNSTLIVSSLTNGCLNFDPRRAAGDTTLLFSCGGRADGEGTTANSQQFPFKTGDTSVLLAPLNSNGQVCLEPKGAILDNGSCDGNANQEFQIVQ